ncbi:NUDIX hydrolase [Streptomyces sp. NPDC006798]|uniref:NUDIX hydrolase n=1 Tax=Streptomyces sp. NPDC006798 TaxID=3155462 RepID=UPI0033EDC873
MTGPHPLPRFHGRVVPWVTPWSGAPNLAEPLALDPVRRRIVYTDETVHDRTDDGVLLARGRGRRATDVAGRPLYEQLDPRRQRKATARLLCQICGHRPPPHPHGPLWLLPDDDGRLPEGELTVTPPVCPSCAALAVDQCPALLRGHIAVRVRYPPRLGVHGRPPQPGRHPADRPASGGRPGPGAVRGPPPPLAAGRPHRHPAQRPRPGGHTVSVPVVLAVITHGTRVPLVRRRLPEGPLLWQFPGGKAELGEPPGVTAVREAREETGLTITAGPVLGERDHPRTRRRLVCLACALVRGTDTTARVAAPREIDAVVWAPYGELDQYITQDVYPPVRRYLAVSAAQRKGRPDMTNALTAPGDAPVRPGCPGQVPVPVCATVGRPVAAGCEHDWVGWSGKVRCRLCGVTRES